MATLLTFLSTITGFLSACFWWKSANLDYSSDFGEFDAPYFGNCYGGMPLKMRTIIKFTQLFTIKYKTIVNLYNTEPNKTHENYIYLSSKLNALAAFYAAITVAFLFLNELIKLLSDFSC